MYLYKFDPNTGKYAGKEEAVLDEFQTAIKGSPAYKAIPNATWAAPEEAEGFTPFFIGCEWVNMPTAEIEMAEAKEKRADAVSKITVTVDGMKFDGDETAQDRMARAITMFQANNLPAEATTVWVLADNTVAEVTVGQLSQALLAAGRIQTELWTKPYEAEGD